MRAFIVGRYNNGSGTTQSATYTIDSYLEKSSTPSLTIDYTLNVIKETDASWDITLLDVNNNLTIRCSGTDNNTRWLVKIELVKITF